MRDDTEPNYTVTNSFLSPELSSSSDYGGAAIDYNIKDPNPVVVSADWFLVTKRQVFRLNEKPTVAVGRTRIV
jgi:hypothetical protein